MGFAPSTISFLEVCFTTKKALGIDWRFFLSSPCFSLRVCCRRFEMSLLRRSDVFSTSPDVFVSCCSFFFLLCVRGVVTPLSVLTCCTAHAGSHLHALSQKKAEECGRLCWRSRKWDIKAGGLDAGAIPSGGGLWAQSPLIVATVHSRFCTWSDAPHRQRHESRLLPPAARQEVASQVARPKVHSA